MLFEPLPMPGAFRIRLERVFDERGFFARRFCADDFRALGLEADFVQRSVSFNLRRGTLRGLHYQVPPAAETKLVRCTRGAAFDVLLDLRPGSPARGLWHGEEISADGRTTLYIPAGVAHGFQTLADETEMDYEITPAYVPGTARGVYALDPQLAIGWPVDEIIMNERDLSLTHMASQG